MPLITPPPSPSHDGQKSITKHLHHRYRLKDLDWDELPSSGISAAKCLGYSSETWMNGEYWLTNYWQISFESLSKDQRRAATYLGWNILDYKLNEVPWSDISRETQLHAITLGWNELRWNDNWPTTDVASHTKYAWKDWKELSSTEKVALEYFGYNQNLWDRAGKEESFVGSSSSGKKKKGTTKGGGSRTSLSPPSSPPTKPTKSPTKPATSSPKPSAASGKQFTQTQLYGKGNGGINLNFLEGETKFDHGNSHRHIDEIWIHADQGRIYGILIVYDKIKKEIVGNIPTDNSSNQSHNNITKLKLRSGEYITSIKVYDNKNRHYVSGISMTSNRGTCIDSCSPTKKHSGQQEIIVDSPSSQDDDIVLCGIFGTATKQHINSIGFRWGPKNLL